MSKYLAVMAILVSTAFAAQPGKVALVGTSYAVHELRVIINHVLLSSPDEEYIYSDPQPDMPWETLADYSLIIASTALATEATPEQQARLRQWVEGGGRLIAIQQVPTMLHLEWAGIASTRYQRDSLTCRVLKPSDPLLQGLPLDPPPPWMYRASIVALPQPPMQTLIGTDDLCLVGQAQVGSGTVTYLGSEVFRLRLAELDLGGAWLDILQRAVQQAQPLTTAYLRAQQLAEWKTSPRQLLCWTREWTRGEEYGPRFVPPLPTPDEVVNELRVDLVIGERESVQLNLTPLAAMGPLSWQLSTGDFPAAQVEFLIQDRVDPIPWPKAPELAVEAPYWMLPPERVAPKGDKRFTMPAPGRARILWLRLNTQSVTAGTYTIKLELNGPGLDSVEIPLHVTVHPVHLPRHRLITLAPGGTVYGDVDRPAEALRFTKNLEEHGAEWAIANVLRVPNLRIAGAPLDQRWIQAHRPAAGADIPEPDFSSLDPWFDQAIDHGLTHLRVFSIDYLLDGMIHRAGYTDAEKAAARQWLRQAYDHYLRQKGYRVFVATSGDELNPAELRETWLPWARSMAEAGWDCTSAFSWGKNATEENLDLLNEISPYIRLWTLNKGLVDSFQDLANTGRLKLRPDAIVGTYGVTEGRGSEHRKNLARSRFLGWYSWRNKLENCLPNPYFKGWIYYCDYGDRGESGGIAGERFVSYMDQEDLTVPLADSPFWDGVRDGLEDGNLAAMLDWYVEKLGATGMQAQIDKLKRDTEAATTTAEFRQARRQVLALLAQLDTASVPASLYWNDVPLIQDGVAVAAVRGPAPLVAAFNERVEALVGQRLPSAGNAAGSGLVISFDAADIPAGAQPPAASHRIYDLTGDAHPKLVIATGSQVTGTLGVTRFAEFLRSTGGWCSKP